MTELVGEADRLFAENQTAAAIPALRAAIGEIRTLPPRLQHGREVVLGKDLSKLAVCLARTGATREALAAAEESVLILTAVSGPRYPLTLSLETVAMSLRQLSERPADRSVAALRAEALLAGGETDDEKVRSRRHRMLSIAAAARWSFANCLDTVATALGLAGRMPEAFGAARESGSLVER